MSGLRDFTNGLCYDPFRSRAIYCSLDGSGITEHDIGTEGMQTTHPSALTLVAVIGLLAALKMPSLTCKADNGRTINSMHRLHVTHYNFRAAFFHLEQP
jgi:hypothetical protein